MSENSSHESHPSASNFAHFAIPPQKFPHLSIGVVNGAHQPSHTRISSGTSGYDYQQHQIPSNMILDGRNNSGAAGGAQSQYGEISSATSRGIYHPGQTTPAAAPWSTPSYSRLVPNSGAESDQPRASPVIQPQHNSWDRSRTPIPRQQTSVQDSNFSHPHNMPGHSAYNMRHPYRPPHNPVEPQAAPSPPSQYPTSPRTPAPISTTVQPPNSSALPVPAGMRPTPSRGSFASIPAANGMSQHQDQRCDSLSDQSYRQDYPQAQEQIAFSIVRDASPRSLSHNLQTYPRQRVKPMLPENGNRTTQPLGPPVYNPQKIFHTTSPISPASNETFHSGYQHQTTRNINSEVVNRGSSIDDGQYRAGPDSGFVAATRPGSRRPTPQADYGLPNAQNQVSAQMLSGGNGMHLDNDETAVDEEIIKGEPCSRTASIIGSPNPSKINISNSTSLKRSRSISSIDSYRDQSPDGLRSINGVMTQRKRKPVFSDPSGKQYFENDVVPLDVQIPDDYTIGIGKIKGQLLPRTVEGIVVNPEWGLTAGGKARQRLPRACESCRGKKIKCVETPETDESCQHCHKMGFSCSGFTKDEGVKSSKKPREKVSAPSSVVSVSLQDSNPGSNGGKNGIRHRGSMKRRKVSDDLGKNGGSLKRGKSSRASSFSTEPMDSVMSGMGRDGEAPVQHQIQTASKLMFATEDALHQNPGQVVEQRIPPEKSRKYYTRQLQQQRFQSNEQYAMYPKSVSETPPHSYTSASPTSSLSGAIRENHTSFMNNGYSRSSNAFDSTPPAMTPTMTSVSLPLGVDPRHHALPTPAMQEQLAEAYFTNIYSQTYAFLHKDTFMQNLNKQPPVLLFSLMAVSARFSEWCHMEEDWAKCARGLILEKFDSNKLEVVQSMINMGLHDFGSGNGQKGWMFAGMAVRMGAALNLNLETKNSDTDKATLPVQVAIKREVARRTYWAYYLMDRMNSYGVARPFLIQDHDCHIQLPCNQPSFKEGRYVITENLNGPNPEFPKNGNEHMGAMAYLVRIVSIWGNILKQIHISGFQYADKERPEIPDFNEQLENWRKNLPTGLQYSNENLAGQIKVGTTGAFVMMHVMWHTAMEYVHRYIMITGPRSDDTTRTKKIVESIRKAFVHADAVLEIMSHVNERRKEASSKHMEPVIVNAPFLGQAISDACNITLRRALELHGEPAGAEEQKARVFTGLSWLQELRRYWKPLEGMYKKLKRACRQLDARVSQPPQSARRAMLHSSGGGIDISSMQPSMSQVTMAHSSYDTQAGMLASEQMGVNLDSISVNQMSFPYTDVISYMTDNEVYGSVFHNSPGQLAALSEIAAGEGGFPNLYTYGGDHHEASFAAMDPMSGVMPVSQSEFQAHASLEPSPMPSMGPSYHESFEMEQGPAFGMEDEDDSDVDENGNPLTPRRLKQMEKEDLFTCFFHPTAVREGKLGDCEASEDSGSESRRESKESPKMGNHVNRMDVLNLLSEDDLVTKVTKLVGEKNASDQMTGKDGSTAPKDGEVKGEVYCDNDRRRPSRT